MTLEILAHGMARTLPSQGTRLQRIADVGLSGRLVVALSGRGAESVEVHVEQSGRAQFVYVGAGYSVDVVSAEASQDLIRGRRTGVKACGH